MTAEQCIPAWAIVKERTGEGLLSRAAPGGAGFIVALVSEL